jgi:hypothetical protein
MPYILYKTNGQKLAVIADGSVDKTTTDLTFVGKNYAGYGEILNQNLVNLLENFANTAEPTTPLIGQTWYDTKEKKLKIYDGSRFKPFGNLDSGSSKPKNNVKGDMWYDEFEKKLKLWDGVKFLTVGPYEPEFNETALIPSNAITDDDLTKIVLKFVVTDDYDRVVIAAVSRDEYTPNPADNLSTEKFNIIKKGISLPGANKNTGDSTSQGFYFWGTAAHALRLGDYAASEFARTVDVEGKINFGLDVPHDEGISVGFAKILKIYADTGNQEGIISVINGTSLSLSLQYDAGSGSTVTTILSFYQNNIIPNPPSNAVKVNLGTSASKFAHFWANTVTTTLSYANTFTGNLIGNVQASIVTSTNLYGTITGDVKASDGTTLVNATTKTINADLTGAISGNITTALIQATGGLENSPGVIRGYWSLYGSSRLRATYADLAERYYADAIYDAGTVLVVGGPNEVTVTDEFACTNIAGIVSENPAYTMNEEAGENKTHPYIALKGRVPCKVVGTVLKGQRLVTSRHPGYACAYQDGNSPNSVIGIALEDHTEDGYGVIEVKV